jgi:hypothetical protein
MKQKKVYSFDGKTGVYSGETLADESPLEPGVFLIPRHATEQQPPMELSEGFAAFWRGDVWSIEQVPDQDEDLDGQQDAPQGFAREADRPGYFVRLVRALVGK